MEIKPLGARVLIHREEVQAQERASGLVVPERAAPATYMSRVKAVGPEVTKVAVGNLVLTTQYVGDEVKANQESLYLLEEVDILAVIEEGDQDGSGDEPSVDSGWQVA